MPPSKPTAHQCVNVHEDTTSHLLLVAHGPDFVNPLVTDVRDLNNPGISFNPEETIPLPGNRRVAVRMVCVDERPGGDVITEGLLAITLVSDNAIVPVADVPVDYIDDPDGP